MKPNQIVAVIITAQVVVMLLYDVWALAFRDESWTVTYIIRTWSERFPILPFTFGVLIGHLFFCQHISLDRRVTDSVVQVVGQHEKEAVPQSETKLGPAQIRMPE